MRASATAPCWLITWPLVKRMQQTDIKSTGLIALGSALRRGRRAACFVALKPRWGVRGWCWMGNWGRGGFILKDLDEFGNITSYGDDK